MSLRPAKHPIPARPVRPSRPARPSRTLESTHKIILDLWSALNPLSQDRRKQRLFASDLLAETFGNQRALSQEQRGEIASSLYGMLQHARRLDFALKNAAQTQDARRPRDLAYYVAYQLLEKTITPEQAADLMPGFDWPALFKVDALIEKESDPVVRLALAHSLPDWLAARLFAEYRGDAFAIAESLNHSASITLRVNLLNATREEVLHLLDENKIRAHTTPLSATAIELESFANIYRLAAFKEGLFEAQDEASQLVAELAMPSPNSVVIDACAGAGGKTLALGALMRGKGRLIALDVNTRRLEELRKRARRAGLSNVRALEIEAEGPFPKDVEAFRGKADRVLVDAPCSGIGAFRRNPDAKWNLSEEALADLPRQQEAISRRAMELCAPNGRLIYATCTILNEENEKIVERLLAGSDFSLVPVKEILGKKIADKISDPSGVFMKLFPHKHHTDGFFAAVLRRAKKS